MKRRLSNLLFGLSAVLCVALLIGWVASFFVIPWGVRNTRQSRIIWGAGDGHVQVICYRGPGWEQQFHDGKTPKPTVWLSFDRTTPHWETSRGLLPQHRNFSDPGDTIWQDGFYCPIWLLGLICGIPWLRRMFVRWRHPHPKGHCRRCGYDLRATPDRCPECGTAPAADSPITA